MMQKGSIDKVDFNRAYRVEVAWGYDDSRPIRVGQSFTVRVTIAITGGGFPISVRLWNPSPHLDMPALNPFGEIWVLGTMSSVPGVSHFDYQATANCSFETILSAEVYSTLDNGLAKVAMAIPNLEPPNPTPEPAVGKILFSRRDVGYVSQSWWTANSDGTQAARLMGKFLGDSAAFSPDGSKIVFDELRGNNCYNISVMNADGSNVVPLTNTASGQCCRPQFSFDGTQIMYSYFENVKRRWQLYVMNADGTSAYESVAAQPWGTAEVIYGTWMRDGRWGVLTFQRDIRKWQIAVGQFVATGGGPFTLFTEKLADLDPAYSYKSLASNPHHDYLALEATLLSSPQTESEIHYWDILGGQNRIRGLVAWEPSFSADGNWIVHRKRGPEGAEFPSFYLSRVELRGYVERQITQIAAPYDQLTADGFPNWSLA